MPPVRVVFVKDLARGVTLRIQLYSQDSNLAIEELRDSVLRDEHYRGTTESVHFFQDDQMTWEITSSLESMLYHGQIVYMKLRHEALATADDQAGTSEIKMAELVERGHSSPLIATAPHEPQPLSSASSLLSSPSPYDSSLERDGYGTIVRPVDAAFDMGHEDVLAAMEWVEVAQAQRDQQQRLRRTFSFAWGLAFLCTIDGWLLIMSLAVAPMKLFLPLVFLFWGPATGYIAIKRFDPRIFVAYVIYMSLRLTLTIVGISMGYIKGAFPLVLAVLNIVVHMWQFRLILLFYCRLYTLSEYEGGLLSNLYLVMNAAAGRRRMRTAFVM